ncbi:hypothetical protein [Aureispira sp. CCB-QB1]|uniref:hypothetical protein n=1 Tax=Aureispira sp. CCB-QB1 TaxID=1313421 RepID=UPI000697CAA2|nr:hypothetical protein [Aureispira sp. CCB-QB1]
MSLVFKEKQKLSGWLLWLVTIILVGVGMLILYGIYQQIILGQPFGDKPSSDLSLIVIASMILGLLIFFWTLNLKTEINNTEIKIHFFPLTKRVIKWNNVQKAQVVDYGFIGGWGLRLSSQYGTVYNASGTMGLAIELKNGTKLLIGTQKSDALAQYVQQLEPFS